MKKKKAIALLCALSLLCSCTQETGGTTEPDSVNAVDPDKSALSEIYTAYSLDGKGGTVEGEAIPVKDRVKFEYTPADIKNSYSESLYEFLSELDMPEITELTERAYTLMLLVGTEHFGEFTNIQSTDAILSFSEYDRWYCTGIDYESFCDAYLEVFTADAAERLFSAYSFFGSYQGELWMVITAMGANVYLVREEYELISKTEKEIVFRRTDFMEDFTLPLYGEPVYDPEKRDQYIQETFDYKFVQTENGWRAEEFSVNSLTTCETEKTESITAPALETPSGVWDDWGIQLTTGTPLSAEELIDFPFEEWILPEESLYATDENLPESTRVGYFLDTLNEPEIKDCFLRAYAAAYLINSDNIPILYPHAEISVNMENGLVYPCSETGYTFDSFYGAYLSAFTEESAQRLIGRNRTFAPYHGELYSMGSTYEFGAYAAVYYEYELLSQTENEVSFRRVCYSEEGDPWGYDKSPYDPEKKGEYVVTYDDFKFVKTEDGWRAEEFMSALDEERTLNVWF